MGHRGAGVDVLVEFIEHCLGWGVVIGVYFLDDYVAFTLHVGGGKRGVLHQVGQQLEGAVGITGRRDGIEHGQLLGGVGVEFAADAFHAVGDVPGAAVARTLEYGMLQEVRQSRRIRIIVAAAGVHRQADVAHGSRTVSRHAAKSVG